MWVSQERQDEIERSTNIRDQRCRKYNNLQFLLWTVLYEYNNIISCRFILFHILYLNINVMFNLYRRNCEKIWILNLRNYIIQFIALIRMLKIFFYHLYRCIFQSMCSLSLLLCLFVPRWMDFNFNLKMKLTPSLWRSN